MMIAAADVKPAETGPDMKSIKKPEKKSEIPIKKNFFLKNRRSTRVTHVIKIIFPVESFILIIG